MAAEAAPPVLFGNAVALSSAGNVALVGAKLDDAFLGSARLFLRRGSGNWVESPLRAPDAALGNSLPPLFGDSVALSSDGATALVGARGDDTPAGIDAGSAYVFDVSDTDGDAILDALDNCPNTPNNDQADLDGDGQGDACDDDRDGDGTSNALDAFPDDGAASTDTDGDGQPDTLTGPSSTGLVEDLDDDGDGLLDTVETNTTVFVDENDTGTDPLVADSDGDGFQDGTEVFAGTNPLDPASNPAPAVPSLGPAGLAGLLALLLAGSSRALSGRRWVS